jgi:HlyD family secretion protein
VWVLRDNKPARVRIVTGLTDGTTTEVKDGELQEGDLVIVGDSTSKTAAGAGSNRGNPSQGGGRRGAPRGPF